MGDTFTSLFIAKFLCGVKTGWFVVMGRIITNNQFRAPCLCRRFLSGGFFYVSIRGLRGSGLLDESQLACTLNCHGTVFCAKKISQACSMCFYCVARNFQFIGNFLVCKSIGDEL